MVKASSMIPLLAKTKTPDLVEKKTQEAFDTDKTLRVYVETGTILMRLQLRRCQAAKHGKNLREKKEHDMLHLP